MKSQKSVWILLLVILITSKVVKAANDEVVKIATEAEKKVDNAEKLIIREQATFKDEIKQAIKIINSTKELIMPNKNLASVVTVMDMVLNILSKFLKTKDFSLSSFQKLNSTSCKKINAMIKKLEVDMEFYLKTFKSSGDGAHQLTLQSNNLKIEYFSNFIFFNKTQSDSVLSIIAMQEKLVDKIQTHNQYLFTATYQIANILYDLKVPKYKICDPKKSSKSVEKTSFKSTKPASKPASTTTTKKTSVRIGDDDEQD